MNGESKLVARPLTDKQRFALECIASGQFRVVHQQYGMHGYDSLIATGGRNIAGQLQPLRRRRFIRGHTDGFDHNLELTLAGVFELYFDGSRVLQ